MNSLLSSLNTNNDIAEERDSVGSSGPLESGLYPATIALAYLNKAASGALGLVLNLKTDTGREIRQTLWMTSGTAKGGNNYYVNSKGEKHYLPGFNHANSLALLTCAKEISELTTETKVVNLWNNEAKTELPTKVEMLTDLLGKEVLIGLIKQTVDKNVKNDAGVYVSTGEVRDENEIDKIFRASDKMTTAEIKAKADEAAFVNTWDVKWTGKTRNRATGTASTTGTAGAPASANKKPTTSLFS